ncbi:TerD family protein [Microbispora amethystogenes]|uniref:TerD family protein n=1 Tax=Microbispora amethystogenes TaxID=1427754 RepID=UPI0033E5A0F5
MSVNLSKGADAPIRDLTRILVGLGWKAAGEDADLDASALLVSGVGRVLSDKHFVFYHNLTSPDGSVEHTGDDRTGSSGGDCEVIRVDLAEVPGRCARIVFAVSIYEGEVRGQTFGQVRDAYIRVVDETTSAELIRYDLTEEASAYPAVVFGELFLHSTGWRFRAIGEGYSGGLRAIATVFGVDVTS